jgi:hypothetical protein
MTFHVGQKVVCIKKNRWIGLDGIGNEPGDPVFGGIYTIASIDQSFLGLKECRSDSEYFMLHFRPVVAPKTDISIFTRMLNPAKEPIS